jgi:hypothetical protein
MTHAQPGDVLVSITRWSTLTATRGTRESLDLIALRHEFERPLLCDNKTALPGWSPTTFTNDRRSKKFVEAVYALVLDYDDGTAIASALGVWGASRGLLHTTWSHGDEKPRFRVVVLLSRPVTVAEYAAVWVWAAARATSAGHEIDQTCKDPSRLWFLPGARRGAPYELHPLDGDVLRVDEILSAGPARAVNSTNYGAGALRSATRLIAAAPEGERNGVLNRQSFAMGQLVAGGELVRTEAEDQMLAAARVAGLGDAETRRTMASGLDAGRRSPRARSTDTAERLRREILISPELHLVVDQAVRALQTDGRTFQRDGNLVFVVRASAPDEATGLMAGAPHIRQMLAATLRERLTSVAAWTKPLQNGGIAPALPSVPVVEATLARGEWHGIRPLVAILESPSLGPTGKLIQRAGYDELSGYLLLPNAQFTTIDEKPTRADARVALTQLLEPFVDFPFQNGPARAVALAAVLTLIIRPAIQGSTPAFLFDANTRGSGKTLLTDVISIIATGRASARLNYPADDTELEKILAAIALRGASSINFDNVSRAFGGGPLDRCITAIDTIEFRILGRSQVPTLRWRTIIMGTGNNIVFCADTSRRVLVARLESPVEHPEARTDFRHGKLVEWVQAQRPRLVRAALTIVLAYLEAGRPDVGCRVWGSFESWSEVVPAALVWAGGEDPMETRINLDTNSDPEKVALVELLKGWAQLDSGAGLTARSAIEGLYPGGRPWDQRVMDRFDELREAIEFLAPPLPGKAPTAQQLGNVLRRSRGRIADGRRLEMKLAGGGVGRWKVVGGTVGLVGQVGRKRSDDG